MYLCISTFVFILFHLFEIKNIYKRKILDIWSKILLRETGIPDVYSLIAFNFLFRYLERFSNIFNQFFSRFNVLH